MLRVNGRFAEAEAAFKTATRVDPEFAQAWYNLGDLLDDQGRSVLAFGDFVAARYVLPGDYLTGFGIDILLLQSVAGLSVDPIKADLFAERRGWIERNRTGDEGQAKVALPVRARGHSILLH
jgi:tetratricopeptide (TPR) repeat protein